MPRNAAPRAKHALVSLAQCLAAQQGLARNIIEQIHRPADSHDNVRVEGTPDRAVLVTKSLVLHIPQAGV